MTGYIYKIESAAVWDACQAAGRYTGSADDARDGFIHFSTAEQARVTATKYFVRRNDLVIAAVDPAKLGNALKWEPSRGGALFPHLYAALAMSAVVWTKPLPLDADGAHVFPVEMMV